MSCGVRYQFSIVNVPKPAKLIEGDPEQIGTPHDAEEAGAADVRRSESSVFEANNTARGRQRTKG